MTPKPNQNQVKVTMNKREILIFDNMQECNQFIESFTGDFADNIMIGAPKETHEDHIELSAIFYNPYQTKPQGQEVLLLDIEMPKQ